jgi:transcriptional antiterminator Rof (Rho-off)
MTNTPESDQAYRPISCARYSEYELFILQRKKLRLTWCEQNILHTQIVQPLDLRTSRGEEYFVCRATSGETLSVRLDRVRTVEPL